MSQAKCLHEPRVLMANGNKHKDGSPVLQCKACVVQSKKSSRRRKIDYDELVRKQGGLCAFCELPLADDNTTHRDHDHVTGKTRGLVHAACNQMIGGIENAMALVSVQAIMRYLGIG